MKAVLIILWLGLTGGLIYVGFIAAMMVICTGGGALVFVIPAVLVILPLYYKFSHYVIFGPKGKNKQVVQDTTPTMPQNKNSVEQYISNAIAFGATDEVIRYHLKNEGGWSDEDIDKELSKFKQ